jgi:hypothetical protein
LDWKLIAPLAGALVAADFGGLVAHYFSVRRDLDNKRRELRIGYLLEAYRRLEDAGNRKDHLRSWPQFESAIADIQLLGSPLQVRLARQFALGMAEQLTASLDDLVNDLRGSLRKELRLPEAEEPVVYLRFNQNGPPSFEETLEATSRDVDDAKIEGAAVAPPDARQLLDRTEHVAEPARAISEAWAGLEEKVRERLKSDGVDAARTGAKQLLEMALEHGLITDVQHRSLLGLNAMRNLAVHGHDAEIDAPRAQEFLTLAEAMSTVLEITRKPSRS